jgi:hypothetical protein
MKKAISRKYTTCWLTFISVVLYVSSFAQSDKNWTKSSMKLLKDSGIELCKTTLPDLQSTFNDLNLFELDEDAPLNKCPLDDKESTLYYRSDMNPGMIFTFQKESTLKISSVRFILPFESVQPDGKTTRINQPTLAEVFELNPQLKDRWDWNDCSDNWYFSTDTLVFFVRIDKEKQPQFPIDKTYYLNKPIEAIDISGPCNLTVETDKKDTTPLYFVDDRLVYKSVIDLYNPDEIAAVQVFRDSTALARYGLPGKNGVICMVTKAFAREQYWSFFRSKSADYMRIVPSPYKEDKIVYILNDKVLLKNMEADLYFVNQGNYIDIEIIEQELLKKNYHIDDKEWGVLIKTKEKK